MGPRRRRIKLFKSFDFCRNKCPPESPGGRADSGKIQARFGPEPSVPRPEQQDPRSTDADWRTSIREPRPPGPVEPWTRGPRARERTSTWAPLSHTQFSGRLSRAQAAVRTHKNGSYRMSRAERESSGHWGPRCTRIPPRLQPGSSSVRPDSNRGGGDTPPGPNLERPASVQIRRQLAAVREKRACVRACIRRSLSGGLSSARGPDPPTSRHGAADSDSCGGWSGSGQEPSDPHKPRPARTFFPSSSMLVGCRDRGAAAANRKRRCSRSTRRCCCCCCLLFNITGNILICTTDLDVY